jgi:hypothetical protein
MNKLYAIKSYSFYAGIIVNKNTIVYAAPILRIYIGWNFDKFKEYAHKSRWAIIDPSIHKPPMDLPELLPK